MSHMELLFTQDFASAKDEIERLGGRVTQKFTDSVFEASVPDDFDPTVLRSSSTSPSFTLDEASELMAAAWRQAASADRPAPGAGRPWNAEGRTSPRNPHNDPELSLRSSKKNDEDVFPSPTSLKMTGTVTLGLTLVSGPTADLSFSDQEKQKVVQQVMQALQFLATSEPGATLNFTYVVRTVTINATAPSSCPSYESCESVWRDPVLQMLGYPVGNTGCTAYANALKQQTSSNWSYLAFFTKYPLFHFAYQSTVMICMQYPPLHGWEIDQINQIFAHETCHVFGAADEYSPCSCYPSGYYYVPNNNCKDCTTTQVACLMNLNDLTICEWSRGQIGWSYWQKVFTGGVLLSDLSVGTDGTMVAIDQTGDLVRLDPSRPWFPHFEGPPSGSSGSIKSVAVRSVDELYVVDSKGAAFQWLKGTWSQYGGDNPSNGFAQVNVSKDGDLWFLDNAGNQWCYYQSPVNSPPTWHQWPGIWSAIAAVGMMNYWAINSAGNVYQSDWPPQKWTQIPGSLTSIAAASDGTVWGINAGQALRYVGGASVWQNITGATLKLSKVAVRSASNVWGLDKSGDLYQRNFTTG